MALISRKVLQAKPPELGRIKIGGLGKEITSKKGNKFQPPVKYDHFVVTTNVRGTDGNFQKDAEIHGHKDVGDKPTELAGILMYPEVEQNFHSEFAIYKGRGKDGKVWTCNGEEATNLKTGATGGCKKAAGKECQCKPYGRLHIQLWTSPYTLGFHTFRTTSWTSVNNIQTALEEIHARFGSCMNAPVKLRIYPSEDRHDDGNTTSHKVALVLAMGMREAANHIAEGRQYLQLASGEIERQAQEVGAELDRTDEEEADYFAAEYHPATRTEVHRQVVTDALYAEDDDEGVVDAEVIAVEESVEEGSVEDAEVVEAEPVEL